MPPHPNFTYRDKHEPEAAHIATAAVLRTLLEQNAFKLDVDRVRQLIGAACADDMGLIARLMWHVNWITGMHDAEGEPEV